MTRMYGKMTTKELNGLLHMAAETYRLDPGKTYIEFTWWDGVFRPLDVTDCDRDRSEFIMLFGSNLCNIWGRNLNGFIVPSGFWIWKDACCADQVVHRPMTMNEIMDNEFMLEFDTVGFMFMDSPVNYRVGVNPYKTRVYKNRGGETILALYAEDRDSGEWRPISGMRPDHIKLVDDAADSRKAGLLYARSDGK